jgi:uncharacterized membrane protein
MSPYSILKMLLALVPVATMVAVVFWLVYVLRYSKEDDQTPQAVKAQELLHKSEIAFQAVVATVLVYFVSHHGLGQALSLIGGRA